MLRDPNGMVKYMNEHLSYEAINEAIRALNFFDFKAIQQLRRYEDTNIEKFDFIRFIHTPDFNLKKYFSDKWNTIIPTLNFIFTKHNMEKLGFTENLIRKNEDIGKIRQAIMLQAVCLKLEHDYLNKRVEINKAVFEPLHDKAPDFITLIDKISNFHIGNIISTTPDKVVDDFITNLKNPALIDISIDSCEIFNKDRISFEYIKNMFNPKFSPAEDIKAANQQRYITFLMKAFTQEEREKHGFTREVLGKNEDIPTIRRAIILSSVGMALENRYVHDTALQVETLHRQAAETGEDLSLALRALQYSAQPINKHNNPATRGQLDNFIQEINLLERKLITPNPSPIYTSTNTSTLFQPDSRKNPEETSPRQNNNGDTGHKLK